MWKGAVPVVRLCIVHPLVSGCPTPQRTQRAVFARIDGNRLQFQG